MLPKANGPQVLRLKVRAAQAEAQEVEEHVVEEAEVERLRRMSRSCCASSWDCPRHPRPQRRPLQMRHPKGKLNEKAALRGGRPDSGNGLSISNWGQACSARHQCSAGSCRVSGD